jgi:hypothetical protein
VLSTCAETLLLQLLLSAFVVIWSAAEHAVLMSDSCGPVGLIVLRSRLLSSGLNDSFLK